MDKIEKELKKLSDRERDLIRDILSKLASGRLTGLDLKKLKGKEDIFRIRKGSIRIIYRVVDEEIFVLAIERRKESTYKL
ncbi:MAG: type II toxin-antitoxin system RelE/ParE family toxin [Patescibacteria group bacterium]|nr:type II toxin-antitoxin system RelE/ParE family toxin [Patescibacteria group bacterium]